VMKISVQVPSCGIQAVTPVTTAAYTIYVEGEGAVLLKHKVNGKTIRMHLKHVLHMLQITTRLLLMG